MIACIHQPNYLPWLGYFAKIAASDLFIVMDNAQFTRNSWINRVRVAGNGAPLWLTVPVKHPGSLDTPIHAIEIDYRENWVKRHLETLRQRYARCPGKDEVLSSLTAILETRPRGLADLNLALIKAILMRCGISTQVLLGSHLAASGQGSELVAQMCQAAGADVYLAGEGAAAYEDLAIYRAKQIEYRRCDFKHPEYAQRGQPSFLPGLSIVDALSNLGAEQTARLLRSHADQRPVEEVSRHD